MSKNNQDLFEGKLKELGDLMYELLSYDGAHWKSFETFQNDIKKALEKGS